MGKKRESSWFAVVKRAFCSTIKSKRQETEEQHQDKMQEKKEGRWVLRKANANQTQYNYNQENIFIDINKQVVRVDVDQTQALAVAAAQAAAVTAQAAAEIARFTRRSTFVRESYNAAVVIQTAFRGYLARRALLALKGIVKLQAVIRGHNVRKQAKLTLRCMQAIVRLQGQMCDHQARLSQERCRKSMCAECNNLWDRYKLQIRQRKSISAERSITKDEWDFIPCVIEENDAEFKSRNHAALKREKALAYAFSQQLWRFDRDINNRTEWLNRWMATKEWDSMTMRGSTDRKDSSIRTVRMDTVTPLSCQTKLVQDRSACPRCLNEERRHSTANTPSPASKYSRDRCVIESTATTPHYMTATESAKAKARSLSPFMSTTGRERVRKRLSYTFTEPDDSDYTKTSSFCQNLTSPSFKSDFPALDRGAYPNSYYGEIASGDISPVSTTHIRRWLN